MEARIGSPRTEIPRCALSNKVLVPHTRVEALAGASAMNKEYVSSLTFDYYGFQNREPATTIQQSQSASIVVGCSGVICSCRVWYASQRDKDQWTKS